MAETGSFWARRKAAVQAEAAAEAAAEMEALRAAREAAEAEAIAAAQADKTEAELLQDLGLPDPDSMAQGDDFAAFMGRAVPEHLRRRALRKLWTSNPVLANLDGLVDHGEDYTDAATVIPGMQTAYQVGKGMMQHVIALAEKAERAGRALEADETVAEDPAEDVAALEAGEDAAVDLGAEPGAEPGADQAVPRDFAEVEEAAPVPRRHMRFEFSS